MRLLITRPHISFRLIQVVFLLLYVTIEDIFPFLKYCIFLTHACTHETGPELGTRQVPGWHTTRASPTQRRQDSCNAHQSLRVPPILSSQVCFRTADLHAAAVLALN